MRWGFRECGSRNVEARIGNVEWESRNSERGMGQPEGGFRNLKK
jgi:hypothetical protein